MSESRPKKRKIEFIESYWTGEELGGDYQWNDNHGELVRCRDCLKGEPEPSLKLDPPILCNGKYHPADWFCADGERKESE